MPKVFGWNEISGHSKPEDLYLVIDGKVYDVTKFQHEHPGGDEFLVDQGGQDVTELFDDAGHSEEARSILKTLAIGTVKGEGGITTDTTNNQAAIAKAKQHQAVSSLNVQLAILVFVGIAVCAPFLYPNLGSTLVNHAGVNQDRH